MAVARDDLGKAAWERGIEGQVTTIRHFGIRCIFREANSTRLAYHLGETNLYSRCKD